MTRSESIHVRVVEDERRVLAQIAKAERSTVSDVLRWLVREEGRRRQLWPPDKPQAVRRAP